MQYEDVIRKFETLSNQEAISGMAKFGITPKSTFGVSMPEIANIAKQIGKNHELAQQLWESDIRETRILACLLDDPKLVSEAQMERWVQDFDYWEICDQCCIKLFRKTKYAQPKAMEWSPNEKEFIKRAGFVLMATLAVHDKTRNNDRFENFLPIIIQEAADERASVKKAINWALRQIGKRNPELNRKAIDVANELQKMDSQSARWIASDALRELQSQAIQKRITRKK
jgi:3-methyladenine DNA glycosylase AlkD